MIRVDAHGVVCSGLGVRTGKAVTFFALGVLIAPGRDDGWS